MKIILRLPLVLVAISFMASCAGGMMAPEEVDGTHIVHRELTEEQVKDAIIEGAEAAGWRAKDLGDNHIVASYKIRVHTVNLDISYSDSMYSTRYSSSIAMKVDCSEPDRNKPRQVTITNVCPGGRTPYYIHGNYKEWVDSLNMGIQNALAAK